MRTIEERWSPLGRLWPRGHILMSSALASKPQVLENCSVLGSKTALFLELLKFGRSPEKNFWRPFFCFGEQLRLCPWSLALASSIPVLGLERVCPQKGCPWPRIFFVSLASSLVSSTPPLLFKFMKAEMREKEQSNFLPNSRWRPKKMCSPV